MEIAFLIAVISAIGFAFSSIKEIKREVNGSCFYTHHNLEAIRGAQAIAISIFTATDNTVSSVNLLPMGNKSKFSCFTASFKSLSKIVSFIFSSYMVFKNLC